MTSTIKINALETGADTLNVGEAGQNVIIGADSIKNNVLKDAAGNAIFTSDGSGVVSGVNSGFGAAPVLLSTTTASDTASVTYTLTSTYKEYIFECITINPVTDNVALQFQVSSDGTNYDKNITSTFFVSGDFIRKFPEALADLSNSGHEVGSLFFVNFNMTDARFRIDKAFIRDGLARNEDEYFQATGNELTTLWHAPFYVVNSTIIDAGKEMNYRYVGRDIDSLDWVTKDNNAAASVYLSAHELAERLIKLKRPGSIIPIDVGVPNGRRDDYLFSKIDGVIDSLIKKGYQLVTVSELVENAK